MGSADDDVPFATSPPSAERRRMQRGVGSSPLQQQPRQPVLPVSMALARGVWLAVATSLLTVAVVSAAHAQMQIL